MAGNEKQKDMNTKAFEIKAYYKSELAMIYFPDMTRRGAVRRLNNWLKINPRLADLVDVSDFTPVQVALIVSEVGEPYR